MNELKTQTRPVRDTDFDFLRLGLASPSKIRSWSFGEIRKPETINYRTFRPERDGLFCARIFGPVKDYECLCGKYKRMKYKGVVCEKCQVEVTQSKVRRVRMGHIELVSPVTHIWFLKSLPSRIGLLTGLTLKNLEKVLYFESFLVLDPGTTALEPMSLLTPEEYEEACEGYGEENFTAMIGAEAIQKFLKEMDLAEEIEDTWQAIQSTRAEIKRKNLIKRLRLLEGLHKSNSRPEWMVLEVLPVIPPDLRPLVPLEGGRFATSDLNDLYRRVINRNNRLKRLLELNAPDIIIRNEKRMLQEAVDVLFDNGRRGKVYMSANKRPLKSLSDMLKGKQGRFRQNLLGKRVDYSGRSVIVVGPKLLLHQCGIPKRMALELFKPFILSRLEKLGFATNMKMAKRIVERERPEVWDILEKVIREHPILLNRAPTLHRLGIQAFEPVLIEGKAIQLHPLVCAAFNADFGGDQMAVHVPLSIESQLEARVLMMSTNNILSPANGTPIIVPSQDIILGLYYLSLTNDGHAGDKYVPNSAEALQAGLDTDMLEVRRGGELVRDMSAKDAMAALAKDEVSVHRIPTFAHAGDMEQALDTGRIQLHQKINVSYEYMNQDGELEFRRTTTTTGRMLLWSVMPRHPELDFDLVSEIQTKKVITNMVGKVYRHAGQKATVIFSDKMMELGFLWACRSGISFGIEDLTVPEEKAGLVEKARKEVQEFENEYLNGVISANERYNKVLDAWTECQNKVAEAMNKTIRQETGLQPNSIYMMAHSGARSSEAQIRQLAGMRGLMAKPSGEIIETPVLSSFKEGLGVLEYFNSTHGARKGLADTALKTANSGYLTRRLVDVAQDCVILEDDCGTSQSIEMRPVIQGSDLIESLSERILGRVLAEDAIDARTGEMVLPAGLMVDEEAAEKMNQSRVDAVRVRSPLMCESEVGVCAQCYGRDMARGTLVSMGEAVGVVAAQSIGEPGTQLTMRTFHIGGAATRAGEDSSVMATVDGTVEIENRNVIEDSSGKLIVMTRSSELVLRNDDGQEVGRYRVPYGAGLHYDTGDKVEQGKVVAEWDPHSKPLICEQEGTVNYVDMVDGISVQEVIEENTGIARKEIIDWRQSAGGADLRPRITLRDADGEVIKLSNGLEARYYVQPGFILSADDGDTIKVGDVLAREPSASSKTSDITGGLPRVVELFEARKPKDASVIADRDGIIRYNKDFKARRRILIENAEDPTDFSEYMISKSEVLLVNEGDVVRKGDLMVEGHPVPHDILSVLGVEALLHHLQREIQSVYRMQGVKISEKHVEIIIRQMLRKVEVVDPGDSMLLIEEQLNNSDARELNKELEAEGKTPVTFRPILHGITKASVQTKSFISAASFQETTRVLTDAATSCKEDSLEGLKENVIVGRLIPAGTGNVLRKLQSVARERDRVIDAERDAKRQAREEAEAAEQAARESETSDMPQADFPEIDLPSGDEGSEE